jgi:hypothetical protein
MAMQPILWAKAYSIFVQPAVTFGCEIWAVQETAKCLDGKQSPYTFAMHKPVLDFLRGLLGLPANSFAAPLYRLFNLKTGF